MEDVKYYKGIETDIDDIGEVNVMIRVKGDESIMFAFSDNTLAYNKGPYDINDLNLSEREETDAISFDAFVYQFIERAKQLRLSVQNSNTFTQQKYTTMKGVTMSNDWLIKTGATALYPDAVAQYKKWVELYLDQFVDEMPINLFEDLPWDMQQGVLRRFFEENIKSERNPMGDPYSEVSQEPAYLLEQGLKRVQKDVKSGQVIRL